MQLFLFSRIAPRTYPRIVSVQGGRQPRHWQVDGLSPHLWDDTAKSSVRRRPPPRAGREILADSAAGRRRRPAMVTIAGSPARPTRRRGRAGADVRAGRGVGRHSRSGTRRPGRAVARFRTGPAARAATGPAMVTIAGADPAGRRAGADVRAGRGACEEGRDHVCGQRHPERRRCIQVGESNGRLDANRREPIDGFEGEPATHAAAAQLLAGHWDVSCHECVKLGAELE